MTPSFPTHIGFPAPLLGDKALRLRNLGHGENWLLLEKPAGIVCDAHPWYPKKASLTEALRKQAIEHKGELQPLWDKEIRSIFTIDQAMSGAIALSFGENAASQWRDRFGSGLLKFKFLILALEAKPIESALSSDLPILSDEGAPQCRISHRYGKKSFTQFKRLTQAPLPKGLYAKLSPIFNTPEALKFGLWEAETDYPRAHQIRLHAAESGILPLGEDFYTPHPFTLTLKDLNPKAQKGEVLTPLYPHVAVHLSAIEGLNESPISIPLPKNLDAFIAKILGRKNWADSMNLAPTHEEGSPSL
jgi:23S rRNA-/tRNA-specific pseudouridylate synthase